MLKLKPIFWIIVALVIVVLLGYSYLAFRESKIEQEGVVVCRENVCEKSIHIHSTLLVSVCGKPQNLPKETGELTDLHTHKEKNTIHFHERLKVAPNGNLLDPTPLMLDNAVQALFNKKLTQECFGEFCNGDSCPNGQPGKLSLTVNGKLEEKIPTFLWQDGNLIELTFE